MRRQAAEGIFLDEEDPCPICACPYLMESVLSATGECVAWENEEGEWFCGPTEEIALFSCMNVHCGWQETMRFHHGKMVERHKTQRPTKKRNNGNPG